MNFPHFLVSVVQQSVYVYMYVLHFSCPLSPVPPAPCPLAPCPLPLAPIYIRRLSDIIRRGKRHFRRSLTRGRSEDDQPSIPIPQPPHKSATISGPLQGGKVSPPRSSSFSSTVGLPLQPPMTPGESRNLSEGTSTGRGELILLSFKYLIPSC